MKRTHTHTHARSKTERNIDQWPEKPSRQTKVGLEREQQKKEWWNEIHCDYTQWEVMCGEVNSNAHPDEGGHCDSHTEAKMLHYYVIISSNSVFPFFWTLKTLSEHSVPNFLSYGMLPARKWVNGITFWMNKWIKHILTHSIPLTLTFSASFFLDFSTPSPPAMWRRIHLVRFNHPAIPWTIQSRIICFRWMSLACKATWRTICNTKTLKCRRTTHAASEWERSSVTNFELLECRI